MSAGAWLMLLSTWSVVIGVSGYLFWKVLTRPRQGAPTADGERERERNSSGPASPQ